MKRSLIWGTGGVFNNNITTIKFQEMVGTIEVIGVTSNSAIYDDYFGYKFIPYDDLNSELFDVIFVAAEKDALSSIYSDARRAGITEDKLLMVEVLRNYKIDIDMCMAIKKNPITIFANNCWGGLTYHSLGLEFCSPLINMFECDEDYIRLLKDPRRYLESPIEYVRDEYVDGTDRHFPVCCIGDVLLFCNHYKSFEDVRSVWDKRVKRIKWNNIFVMMSTENPVIAKEFSLLPYERKVCFVPFESELKDVRYVTIVENPKLKTVPFWRIIMGMANGAYPYYDVASLLGYRHTC